jgi:hypothetical protein
MDSRASDIRRAARAGSHRNLAANVRVGSETAAKTNLLRANSGPPLIIELDPPPLSSRSNSERFLEQCGDGGGVRIAYRPADSNGVRTYDEAAAAYAAPGTLSPIRNSETFIEAFYQIQLAPWWQLQPDFQYIFNPGGGVVNSSNPTQLVHDEAVFGLRTTIAF